MLAKKSKINDMGINISTRSKVYEDNTTWKERLDDKRKSKDVPSKKLKFNMLNDVCEILFEFISNEKTYNIYINQIK